MESGPVPPLQQPEREEHQRGGTRKGQLSLSCAQCRSRKLKCDRKRPRCDRCVERNEACAYPEIRQRGLGPRKTVRELEERIEELEGLLQAANLEAATHGTGQDLSSAELPSSMDPGPATGPLVDLGLFEQAPSFELMDALTAVYFQAIHPGAPMLHQARYTGSLRLPPHMRAPMCLQYIVMASAAAVSPPYRHLSEPFYQRARVYAEADELKGQGEVYTTVAHVQAWLLISAYECHVYAVFTRASTSHCRAVRIAQMLKLHQLDNQQHDLGLGLPPPSDPIEAEERRRTWWVVFMADRFLTTTTGWPSLVDERRIRTNLPSTEEAFAAGTANPHPTPLSAGLRRLEQGRGDQLSPFALRLLAANELLHALDHTANSVPDTDVNSPYWRRHHEIDSNLTTLAFFLPQPLMNPSANPRSLDAITVHICVSMAVLHLHRSSSQPSSQWNLNSRLLPAAQTILSVFHAAHTANFLGTAIRNPLLPFAAYMAASVFLADCMRIQQSQSELRSQSSETNLAYLADTLVLYAGKESPLVRANALQLAGDLLRAGILALAGKAEWMMDRLLRDTEGNEGGMGGAEIVASKEPMLFCPALSAVRQSGGGEGIMGGGQGGGGSSDFFGGDYDDSPWAGASPSAMRLPAAAGSSVLQAGEPSGLFSQLSYIGVDGFTF
ncbi:fungal-specific transcription factor domain-containing protein [Achaetomium macrosporum]|uniref:Fungal-specific transcription factor domain-containing protein n=1 Tax=Achaetomium macrosporum TaxID=79813 RepID=A0AAN7HA10_9PEZI|nr:fungal-specific transcription factor domain-containing protein [Achaetomium macrosporum]